ncbi:MAG: DUF2817 domain-containing protein [Alcanivoracaceae bacterium]|nr:DUF2817 domain-containing protein [Alcanivoracaceae bacterium]
MFSSLLNAHSALIPCDYHACRDQFVASANRAPKILSRRAEACPASGPQGDTLFTDVVWLGSDGASKVLVLISGTHGCEGFAGSAIQTDFLNQAADTGWHPPADTAVLLVHALNPWGMAWSRRCDHDGIDLNRNFIDFDQPVPANPGYLTLRDALMLEHSHDRESQLQHYGALHGQTALEIAVSGGQYSDPSGAFFGGFGKSHGRLLIEKLINEFTLGEKQLAVIDLHTGLGPYGYGEIICDHDPHSDGTRVAHNWYGDAVTLPLAGTSSSVPKLGLMDYGWHAIMDASSCFVTLEYGTYGTGPLFDTILSDHRLHAAGEIEWSSPRCQAVKQQMRRHFCPPDRQWQEMVLWRARQVIHLALEGLQH